MDTEVLASAVTGRGAVPVAGVMFRRAVGGVARAVPAGDLVVLVVQVSTGSGKAVALTDTAGTTYAVAASRSDSTGAKLSILYGRAVKALPAGAKLTLGFQSATAFRAVADDLAGVTTLDRTTSGTGLSTTFSSGATATTTAVREVVLGVAALIGGSRAPTCGTGWTAAGTVSAGSGYVGRAYQTTVATGRFTAAGTATGTWSAAALTFRP